MQDILISSPRLHLRPFSPEDAAEALACITPSLARFMSWEPPESAEAFAAIWPDWLARHDAGTDTTFTIRHQEDGRFLGLGGLHQMDSDTPEPGIWIREDAHGYGYGREAVTLIVHWACRHLHPVAFIYPVAEQNVPSRRIAESLGGQVTGTEVRAKYTAVLYRIPVEAGHGTP